MYLTLPAYLDSDRHYVLLPDYARLSLTLTYCTWNATQALQGQRQVFSFTCLQPWHQRLFHPVVQINLPPSLENFESSYHSHQHGQCGQPQWDVCTDHGKLKPCWQCDAMWQLHWWGIHTYIHTRVPYLHAGANKSWHSYITSPGMSWFLYASNSLGRWSYTMGRMQRMQQWMFMCVNDCVKDLLSMAKSAPWSLTARLKLPSVNQSTFATHGGTHDDHVLPAISICLCSQTLEYLTLEPSLISQHES